MVEKPLHTGMSHQRDSKMEETGARKEAQMQRDNLELGGDKNNEKYHYTGDKMSDKDIFYNQQKADMGQLNQNIRHGKGQFPK